MKGFVWYVTLLFSALFLACNSSQSNSSKLAVIPTKDTIATNIQNTLEGDFCFIKILNHDTTWVRFRILSSDDIRGEMIWQPADSHGAVGELTGKLISNNEMELLYKYTIEGSNQSEVKIMKIEGDTLWIKSGELVDPNNDGNLILKDKQKAAYKEKYHRIPC